MHLSFARFSAAFIGAACAITASSQLLAATSSQSHSTGCTADKSKFHAWFDQMPGAAHKLMVTGEGHCPTTGWHVALVEVKPQGISSSILILELKATAPSGNAGNVVTSFDVRFERTKGSGLQEVTVRGGGPDFTIPVSQTQ